MSELPTRWAWATPQELAAPGQHTLGIGPFGSDLKVSDYTDSGTPLIFVRNIRAEKFARDGEPFITTEKADQLRAHRVLPGDVLITKMGDPPGDACLYPALHPAAVMTADCIRLRPNVDVAGGKFLVYAARSSLVREQVLARTTGVAQKKVSLERFASVRFPLAPPIEQQRIVEALDSYLTRLDAATEGLKRVEANLKRYRASVLKAAVEGRLLRRRASTSMSTLSHLLLSIEQGWSPECHREPAQTPEQWGVIKTTAVQPMSFSDGENKQLPTHLVPRLKLELRVGDLLTTRAGPRSRVGITCLVRHSRPRLILCDKVYRMRVREDLITPGYLEIALNSPPLTVEIERLKTGISDSGVNLTQVRFLELAIPTPNLEIQREIEDAVGSVFSVIDSQLGSVERGLSRIYRLRQSILKWAFEGKLVDQDPKDEPASVLLERIRKEREAAASEPKRGPRAAKRKSS